MFLIVKNRYCHFVIMIFLKETKKRQKVQYNFKEDVIAGLVSVLYSVLNFQNCLSDYQHYL